MQIDIIAKILDDTITTILYSKFIDHIYPDDKIVYHVQCIGNAKKIIIKKDTKKISEIKYETK